MDFFEKNISYFLSSAAYEFLNICDEEYSQVTWNSKSCFASLNQNHILSITDDGPMKKREM
jgi:hypothetical protein